MAHRGWLAFFVGLLMASSAGAEPGDRADERSVERHVARVLRRALYEPHAMCGLRPSEGQKLKAWGVRPGSAQATVGGWRATVALDLATPQTAYVYLTREGEGWCIRGYDSSELHRVVHLSSPGGALQVAP